LVRYYACEALYNVSKVSFSGMLTYFNELFTGLTEIYAEPGKDSGVHQKDGAAGVRTGADMLNRLIKDIIIDQNALPNMSAFVIVLRERIQTTNQLQRMFLVEWVSTLESVPGIDLLRYLPNILEGLFKILCDDSFEVRRHCEQVLDAFLAKITKANNSLDYPIDYPAMMEVLIAFCGPSKHLISRFMAVTWLRKFIALAQTQMLPFAPGVVKAILPCLAMSVDDKLRALADLTNKDLMALLGASDLSATTVAAAAADGAGAAPLATASPATATPSEGGAALAGTPEQAQAAAEAAVPPSYHGFDHGQMLQVLTVQLLDDSVATRMATLAWFSMLHAKIPIQTFERIREIAPALLKSLSDSADKVVRRDLKLLAELSTCTSNPPNAVEAKEAGAFFNSFIVDLLRLFSTDRELLEYRGSFIIRHLSTFVNAEKLYRALAGNLLQEEDLEFANRMVQNLNLILLTSPELHQLRADLKNMNTPESKSLFSALYRTWCHNPVATFSLCLLTQVYEHACELLGKFGELEVTVSFLVEVDKLIQLLESPIFTFLRLQLLEPQRYAYLVKALYGILMLLPQSSAFHTLKNRLDSMPTIISSLQLLQADTKKIKPKSGDVRASIDFKELGTHFDEVQKLSVGAIANGHQTRGRTQAL